MKAEYKKYYNAKYLKQLTIDFWNDKYEIKISSHKELNKNRYTINIQVINKIKRQLQNFQIIENWNLKPKDFTEQFNKLYLQFAEIDKYIINRYPDIKEFLND